MITKGDTFECIKDVVMNKDREDIAYHKGKLYKSEHDDYITNENGNTCHLWGSVHLDIDPWLKYFKRVPADYVPMTEADILKKGIVWFFRDNDMTDGKSAKELIQDIVEGYGEEDYYADIRGELK